MQTNEAVLIAAKVLARYPSSPRDELTIGTWAEELMERLSSERAIDVEAAAVACCRAKGGTFAPSLDELCGYVAGRLKREAPRALPEPDVPEAVVRENLRRVREIIDGLSAKAAV
jgi:hypothetical protein